ncbi:MAG: hypothetical protein JNM22_09640 [Saprospiraceae bacterium]|nr:hypothetical protein [Saprospiraceae bacterium]
MLDDQVENLHVLPNIPPFFFPQAALPFYSSGIGRASGAGEIQAGHGNTMHLRSKVATPTNLAKGVSGSPTG